MIALKVSNELLITRSRLPPWPISETKDILVPPIFLQTFCCHYPHIDFAFVDFVMTPVIPATLKNSVLIESIDLKCLCMFVSGVRICLC